jgi:hypothetical protein
MGRGSRPRMLCHFNHYFGTTSSFDGKSTTGTPDQRDAIVRTALAAIRALPFNVDVRICGVHDCSLLPIDVDLSDAVGDPQHIVYASIERMFDAIDDYDYFLNIEDDILIAESVVRACIRFHTSSACNEVFLPNRIEIHSDGVRDCVDLVAIPGWQPSLLRTFDELKLGVATNPHSGLAFLGREQMYYAAERVNLAFRDLIIGGFMASAYANLHKPFLLWRARSDLSAHAVVHLDPWSHRPTPPVPRL